MFLERLNKEEFNELITKFIKNKRGKAIKIDILPLSRIIEDDKDNTILINSKRSIPYTQFLSLNDFNAEYCITGVFSPPIKEDKSQNLRDYLYVKFGEEYLTALKKYLEHDKTEKVERLKNKLEEENRKVIEELTK